MQAGGRFLGSALLLLIVGGGVATSQSADLMMAVSGQDSLRVGEAAALIGIVGGSLPSQAEPATAVDELRRIGYVLPQKQPAAPITVGEFSFLIIQLLDLPAGMLYSIFPGPRYAVRELVARGVLAAGVHPGATLSGSEALRILGTLSRGGE